MAQGNPEGLDSTMVYRADGAGLLIHIDRKLFGHKVVATKDLPEALADGWFLTSGEAAQSEAEGKETAPLKVSRSQMEADAATAGLKIDKRWSDARLSEELAKFLKA